MFESIKSIKPYFHSLREIENTISLDIKMPLTWKFEEITKQYQTVGVKLQDKNNNHTLISIVSKSDQEGYDIVFTCALDIINVNKEEEEKRELFQRKQKKLQEEYQLKIKELEERFKNEPLDKLKDLNLLEIDGQEITSSIGVVGETNGEGQGRNRKSQKQND